MKIFQLLGIASVFIICYACNSIEQQYSDGGASQQSSIEPVKQAKKHIKKIPNGLIAKHLLGDFNNNGISDSIILTVAAERHRGGGILWDDGHQWKVFWKENEDIHLLYDESIQLGKLEVHSSADGMVYLRENSPYAKEIYIIKDENSPRLEAVEELPSKTQSFSFE